VLANQCDRAHQEANEVGLNKGPLDLPVVDFAGPMHNDSLRQNESACWLDQGPQDVKFSVVFPQKDHPKGSRKEVANHTDNNRRHRVDHEESIEALARGEVVLEVFHFNAVTV